MNKGFIASAAALVLAAGLTANVAEAGQKTLKFGYPLGSFTAHSNSSKAGNPSLKSGHSTYKTKQRAAAKKKAIARKRAAQKTKLAKQRKIAAQREIAERKKQERAARLAKLRQERAAEKAKVAEADATKTEAAPVEKAAATTPETSKRAPVKASALAGVNGLLPGSKVIDQNSDAVITAKVEKTADGVAPPSPTRAPEKELSCKKYIPSAGLTVSVPCSE